MNSISFPSVSATSLAGESFDFPGSFGADYTLVLLAFWDWQQPMVDSWIEIADRLEVSEPGLEYFEMPVVQASNHETHQQIDDAMRSGIHSRRAREKTIPLYVAKRAFLRRLGLPTDDEVYALLVDRSGIILRLWTGSRTPAATAQLEELLETSAAAA
jgi:hypothetical protein